MNKTLLVDLSKCTGCELCVEICSGRRSGVYSEQNSCIRIKKNEFTTTFMPLVCEQCREQFCLEACPVEAIKFEFELNILIVDDEVCTACGLCQQACVYEGIFVEKETALKCDLCRGEPACATVCDPGALETKEVDQLAVMSDLEAKLQKIQELLNDSQK